MYVCVCKAVTERNIHEAVSQGCHSMRELRRQLGVVTECGRCGRCARQVLEEAKRRVQAECAPAMMLFVREAV